MIESYKKFCSGCRACEKLCPTKAIKMEPDYRGFLYPTVDYDKCIKCKKCINSCSINNKENIKEKLAYAAYNKDEKTRINSSSGGIFTLLAENIIEKGGIVFGAAFANDFTVEHILVQDKKDLEKLRTSKYVQSDTKNSYVEAEKFLKQGKLVYYSGTPCQIEGLKAYLQKEYDNLILQDIICHGVPSPKVWKEYLKSKNNKIKKVNFRSKEKTTWDDYQIEITYEGYKEYANHNDDIFMKLFLENLILRDSCYSCKFKKENRESDLTLADFWGISKIDKSMDDNKGTSLVILNSSKGKKIFEEISNKIIKKEVNFKDAIKNNSSMIESSKKGLEYNYISKLIKENMIYKLFEKEE